MIGNMNYIRGSVESKVRRALVARKLIVANNRNLLLIKMWRKQMTQTKLDTPDLNFG